MCERIDYFIDCLSDPRLAQQADLVRTWPIPKVSLIELRRVLRPTGGDR